MAATLKISVFPPQTFLAAASQIKQYPWLPADLPHLETSCTPILTSSMVIRSRTESVVEQMLNRFEVAMPLSTRSEPNSVGSAPVGDTASIVEKRLWFTQSDAHCWVFSQRLLKEVSLGADPTVEYGLGIRQTVDQPLTCG